MFLETAHPVKFYDVVEPVINAQVPIPEIVKSQLLKEKKSRKIGVDTGILKEVLTSI